VKASILPFPHVIFSKIPSTVEIKCQLDATEVFIADLTACSTCFGHHYAHHQELKSIIQWLLPVAFRAVIFKLLVWCGAEGYVSGLQDATATEIMPFFKGLACAIFYRRIYQITRSSVRNSRPTFIFHKFLGLLVYKENCARYYFCI